MLSPAQVSFFPPFLPPLLVIMFCSFSFTPFFSKIFFYTILGLAGCTSLPFCYQLGAVSLLPKRYLTLCTLCVCVQFFLVSTLKRRKLCFPFFSLSFWFLMQASSLMCFTCTFFEVQIPQCMLLYKVHFL